MLTLDQLAKRECAFEKADRTRFQREARVLQSLWRAEKRYECGHYRGRRLGSLLKRTEDPRANFLDDCTWSVVQTVLEDAKGEGKLISRSRLFNNLLSSQPLAFNLFGHLSRDRPLATRVFAKMSPGRVAEVVSVDFEHSPGRGDRRFTGDRSAFDVFVRYRAATGGDGFAGIEVKYHEDLQNKPSKHHPRYDEIAAGMKCFAEGSLPQLRRRPLQQVWRDHLLAGSLLQTGEFSEGMFVVLSPARNQACEDVVKRYRACLTNSRTFEHWHLEDFVGVLRDETSEPWVTEFHDRYLDFDKVSRALRAR
jgi:hypothetical protein